MPAPSVTELFFQLLLAVVIGGAIGLEREWSGKAAGLRTQILVCVGSLLFTILSLSVSAGQEFADPARIAAQIVSGLGFLGGAVVLKSKGDVRGVTTAATIWAVAALGVGLGAREYGVAVLGAAVILAVLGFLGRMERLLNHRPLPIYMDLTLAPERTIRDLLAEHQDLAVEGTIQEIRGPASRGLRVQVVVRSPGCTLAEATRRLSRSGTVEEYTLRPG